MAKLRMAHASMHGARKPPGPIKLNARPYSLSETEAKCDYDYVQILYTNGKTMQKLCGSGSLSPITSTGNKMTVKFHSDYSNRMKGWKFKIFIYTFC